jgi:hypothetical protein
MADPLHQPDPSPPRRKRRFWLPALSILALAAWVALAVVLFKQSREPDATGPGNQTAGANGTAGPDNAFFDADNISWREAPSQPAAVWEPPGIAELEGADVVAARHQRVIQSAAEVQQLAEAHRDALAELAKALAADPRLPANALLEQLETESQLLESQLSAMEALADRIALFDARLARLTRLEAEIAPGAGKPSSDRRDLPVCQAARAGAALALSGERYRDQLTLPEILILEDQVAHLHQLYEEIDALYRTGAAGGESENWSIAGYELSRGRAELAKACGDRPAALARLHEMCEFAAQHVEAYGVNMGGPPPWGPNDVARARNSLTTARVELLRYARLLGDKREMDWAEKGRPR